MPVDDPNVSRVHWTDQKVLEMWPQTKGAILSLQNDLARAPDPRAVHLYIALQLATAEFERIQFRHSDQATKPGNEQPLGVVKSLRSKCCNAPISAQMVEEGMIVGICTTCRQNVLRINPKTNLPEYLNGKSPWTEEPLEQLNGKPPAEPS